MTILRKFMPGFIIALVVCITACENPAGGEIEKSSTPTADAVFIPISETPQKTGSITLTSSNIGKWNVYDAPDGGSPLTDITAFFSPTQRTLTLTSFGETLETGDYYVSVTETGKTESDRLEIKLRYRSSTPSIPPVDAAVELLTETQASVVFTLSEAIEGEWRVYSGETGSTVPPGITVTVEGTTLTLSSGDDPFTGGVYYVAVTQTDKAESSRLALTVNPYDTTKTKRPELTETQAVKTTIPTTSVPFTLTQAYTSEPAWKVYTSSDGENEAAGITVSSTGTTLTLSSATDIPTGVYFVAATEGDKSESNRTGIEITLPRSITFTVGNNTVTGETDTSLTVPVEVRSSPGTTGPSYEAAGSGKYALKMNTTAASLSQANRYSETSAGDWISMDPIAGAYMPQEKWTMEMIVNFPGISSGSRVLRFYGPSGAENSGAMWLEHNHGGYWLLRVFDRTQNPVNQNVRINRPSTGTWHHVAYVRDGGTITCYVDGVQGTASGTSANTNNPNANFGTPANAWLNHPDFAKVDTCLIGITKDHQFHQFKISGDAITPTSNAEHYTAAQEIVTALKEATP